MAGFEGEPLRNAAILPGDGAGITGDASRGLILGTGGTRVRRLARAGYAFEDGCFCGGRKNESGATM